MVIKVLEVVAEVGEERRGFGNAQVVVIELLLDQLALSQCLKLRRRNIVLLEKACEYDECWWGICRTVRLKTNTEVRRVPVEPAPSLFKEGSTV